MRFRHPTEDQINTLRSYQATQPTHSAYKILEFTQAASGYNSGLAIFCSVIVNEGTIFKKDGDDFQFVGIHMPQEDIEQLFSSSSLRSKRHENGYFHTFSLTVVSAFITRSAARSKDRFRR